MKHYSLILKVFLLSWLIGGSGGEVVACTAPTASEFSHSNVTATVADLSATAVGIAIQFRYKLASDSTWTETGTPYVSPKTISGLEANTSYHFAVRQQCSNGLWSDWSLFQLLTTQSGTCGAPTHAQISHRDISPNSVYLYNYSLGISRQMRYKETTSTEWEETPLFTCNFYVATEGVQENTTYEYQGRRQCNNGVWSNWSSSLVFTTMPNNCTAPTISQTDYISIEYNAIQLGTSASGIVFQFRYKLSTSDCWTTHGTTHLNYHIVSGLQSNTSYHYAVRRICSINTTWSNWSPTKTFMTDIANSTMEAAKSARELHIFPNPAHDAFTVHLPERTQVLSLHDASGRLLRRIDHPDGNQIAIPADGLGQGLILLSAIDTEGHRWHAKVVLQGGR